MDEPELDLPLMLIFFSRALMQRTNMARPNLLLCFDAFGTLFRPKRNIIQQYGEIARQCGLVGFKDEELQSSFREAFKEETKKHPNYGKVTGLGATKWWTNVGYLVLPTHLQNPLGPLANFK
jgi:hypothetical protein